MSIESPVSPDNIYTGDKSLEFAEDSTSVAEEFNKYCLKIEEYKANGWNDPEPLFAKDDNEFRQYMILCSQGGFLSQDSALLGSEHEIAHANAVRQYAPDNFLGYEIHFELQPKIRVIGVATLILNSPALSNPVAKAHIALAPALEGVEDIMDLSEGGGESDYSLYLEAQRDHELASGHEGESLLSKFKFKDKRQKPESGS